MKAFVIKNKEGEYLQYFDADSDDIGFTNDLTLAMLYNENEMNIMKKAYQEFNFIEITIAEGDLEHQLAEKEKEIEDLRNEIARQKYAENTVEEKILTEKEKEYLEAVIRPFKDRVQKFIKQPSFGDENLIVKIRHYYNTSSNDYLEFPEFKPNTMYKGMELDKEYTLEELGVFKEK